MSADFWPWGHVPSGSVIYGCKLLLSVRTLCGLSWGASLQRSFLVFSARTSGAVTIWEPIFMSISLPFQVGANCYLRPTWGQTCGYKLSGETFFPLRVLPEIEKVPCYLLLWGEFLLVHQFSENITEGPGSTEESQFSCPTSWLLLCHLPTSPFVIRMAMISRVTETWVPVFQISTGGWEFPSHS